MQNFGQIPSFVWSVGDVIRDTFKRQVPGRFPAPDRAPAAGHAAADGADPVAKGDTEGVGP